MIDYLEMIAKLLAKAEGATTDEERAAYQQKAQQLATNNSIDMAKARHVKQSKEQTTPEQRSITIGVPGTEGLKTLVQLYLGIADANDLKCLIAQNSTRVYAIGFPEDIDVSEALYASLVTQMTNLVEEYKAENAWRTEKVWTEVWKNGYSDGGAYRNINWRTARLNFQYGFAAQIASRLATAKRAAERQRIRDEADAAEARLVSFTDTEEAQRETGEPGTELVLANKRAQLNDYYDNKVRKGRGHYRSDSRSNANSSGARRAGVAAANRASIAGSTPLGGARKGIAR